MRGWSWSWRLLPPGVLGAIAAIGSAFATNELTAHGPVWWWAVLATFGVLLVIAGVWTYLTQKRLENDGESQSAKALNQTAGAGGTNVSLSADNNSVAAWQIETLNMRERPKDEGSC